MADIASRELRNDTRGVLQRVERGEVVRITVDGRPVALLSALPTRRREMSREEFLTRILPNQADPGLTADLAADADETTDDLAWP